MRVSKPHSVEEVCEVRAGLHPKGLGDEVLSILGCEPKKCYIYSSEVLSVGATKKSAQVVKAGAGARRVSRFTRCGQPKRT